MAAWRALLLAAALATTSALSSSISAKDRVRPPPSRSEDGFPAVFDRGAFEAYLDTRPGTVAKRAAAFAAEAGPLQLRAASLWASGQLRRDDAAFAASVRGALERLGPAFVKIGQLLSVREDVLGPVWSRELAELQAGVHRATWQADDGALREVAVKIVRPGVVEAVAVDLCVLLRAAELLETWAPRLLPKSEVDWRDLLEGLAAALWEEVDLRGEARRQARFRDNMAKVRGVAVPEVLASSRRVLVSEWVDGVPVAQLPDEDARLKVAVGLARDAYCQSMYVDGFFHSDCHGGNLLLLGDDRLCILDCGLMVDIEEKDADGLLALSLALAARDWTRVVASATTLGFLPEDLDAATRARAEAIVARIVGPYVDVGGGARAASSYVASSLFADVAAASADLPTALPPKMVLLGRAVLQLEGLALRADPGFKIVDDILPTAARLAVQNPRRDASGSLLYDLLTDVAVQDSGSFSPDKLRALLRSAKAASSVDSTRDLFLEDEAARDVACDEAADALDALGRDFVWALLGDEAVASAPPALRDATERLVPRVTDEERAVLDRLPQRSRPRPATAAAPLGARRRSRGPARGPRARGHAPGARRVPRERPGRRRGPRAVRDRRQRRARRSDRARVADGLTDRPDRPRRGAAACSRAEDAPAPGLAR
ncbi:PFAM ABC-1 domain protein [Aureococcus anophagefferens]|uniref:PFAM ABC-1 domain protein n=1 Tax=Aureococcus anophagefferens TaxID=44056 RepID=A0ABR1FT83_AURAN